MIFRSCIIYAERTTCNGYKCTLCTFGNVVDGVHASAPHPLPWIDGGVINGTSEDLTYIGDAVADYENGRHT